MVAQTISLFRYLMLGILSWKLVFLLAILTAVATAIGGFIGELAMINGSVIVAALIADFLRYSLALLVLLLIASSVAEDYDTRQFERLISMPLRRWQYVVAQLMVVASLCLVMVTPVLMVMLIYADWGVAIYWAAALWMEVFLLGLVGLLAILSLEKIPQAVFFALAIYALAKLSGLISQMLSETVKLSDGSLSSRFSETVFNTILFVIPGPDNFAQNDVFFGNPDLLLYLGHQSVATVVFAAFVLAICLIDFYRKEFNL